MKRREEGTLEIHNRILQNRVALGLKGLKRTPTRPADEKFLPCVFINEGKDEITRPSARSSTGYPCRRVLEVHIEIIGYKSSSDIKALYRAVRSTIFNGGVVVADDNTMINEIRTEGPTGYGLPDIIGMVLVLGMSYNDDGN